MPGWVVRTVESVQAVVIIIVFAWALASATSFVRRHVSLSPPGPPTGSYVAVAASGPIHGDLKSVVQTMLEDIVADLRLGG